MFELLQNIQALKAFGNIGFGKSWSHCGQYGRSQGMFLYYAGVGTALSFTSGESRCLQRLGHYAQSNQGGTVATGQCEIGEYDAEETSRATVSEYT